MMSSKRVLKIAIGVLLTVCFFYAMYALLFLQSPKKRQMGAVGGVQQVTFSTNPNEHELDTITTTIEGKEFSYLKAQFVIEAVDSRQKSYIAKNEPLIRRIIIAYSSRLNGEDLSSSRGKDEFRQSLLREIEKGTGQKVHNLYFTKFVLAKREE